MTWYKYNSKSHDDVNGKSIEELPSCGCKNYYCEVAFPPPGIDP